MATLAVLLGGLNKRICCYVMSIARTFAVGVSDHCFDLAVKWITAEEPQSVTQLRCLDAVAAVSVELREQCLVFYRRTDSTSSQNSAVAN